MPRWEEALEELDSATARLDAAHPGDAGALDSALRDRFYAVSRIAELVHAGESQPGAVSTALRRRIERALEAGAQIEARIRLMRAGLRAEMIEAGRTRAVLQALAAGADETNRTRVDCSG
jgi:hypothetical protein